MASNFPNPNEINEDTGALWESGDTWTDSESGVIYIYDPIFGVPSWRTDYQSVYNDKNRYVELVGDNMVGDLTFADDRLRLSTSGAAEFAGGQTIIDSSGNVGIGTTTPNSNLTIDGGATTRLQLITGGNEASSVQGIDFYDRFGAGSFTTFPGQNAAYVRCKRNGTGADFSLTFGTAGATNASERMRIDSSGRLLIGTDTVLGNSTSTLIVNGNTNGTFQQGELQLNNGVSPVMPNYGLGEIRFSGEDIGQIGAKIQAFSDSGWNTGEDTTDSPGRIEFATTANGASTPTTRLTINSEGKNIFEFNSQAPSGPITNAGQVIFDEGNSSLAFGIDSSLSNRACWLQARHPASGYENIRYGIALNPLGGSVTIGSLQPRGGNVNEITDASSETTLLVTKQGNNSNSLVAAIYNDDISGNNNFIGFFTESTAVGRGNITFNRSSGTISYGTTSDARLKTNITDSPAATIKLNQIQVRSFNWNEKGFDKTEYGFIAQELNTIFPGAVIEGDNEENITQQWQVDNSKLVPLLTKALQETIAKVESLEAEISKLRSN